MPPSRRQNDPDDVDFSKHRRCPEERTPEDWVHKPPCGEHRAFRAYAISIALFAGSVAIYLWLRMDRLNEAGTTHAVSISAIVTRLDNIDNSLARIETSVNARMQQTRIGP